MGLAGTVGIEHDHGSQMGSGVGRWDRGLQPERVALPDTKTGPPASQDAVMFARERLGFDPDEKQELVLRGGRRGIVNCTRQWGKSTVTAAKAVHRADTEAGSLILVVTPCAR